METNVSTLTIGGVVLLLLGAGLGATIGGGKYADGRLSACKDFLNIMTRTDPLMMVVQPQCVPYKGDVAIKIGEGLFSLDGTKKLN